MNPFAKAFEPKSLKTLDEDQTAANVSFRLDRPLSPLSFLLGQNVLSSQQQQQPAAASLAPSPPRAPPGLDDDDDDDKEELAGSWNPFTTSFEPSGGPMNSSLSSFEPGTVPASLFGAPSPGSIFEPVPMRNVAFEPEPRSLPWFVPAMNIWSTPEQWLEKAARAPDQEEK